MSTFSRLVLASAQAAPVRRVITGTRAGRALAGRFVAGETLDQAISCARQLGREGMQVSLDLLGEEVTDSEEVEQALKAYVECLENIADSGVDGNISIKLTQLGLAFDRDLAAASLDLLAIDASSLGLTVTIDMEDSDHTEATVEIYEQAQARHANLGICLQAYLHRTPDHLTRLLPLGGHIRLCKGAYAEPPELALQTRAEVDAAFARLLQVLMAAESIRPAIATHDPSLIALTRELAVHRREPFEFQMLYGVRVDEQHALVGSGHGVRVYVPFGTHWYPYLTRRLAERPANLGFLLRALVAR